MSLFGGLEISASGLTAERPPEDWLVKVYDEGRLVGAMSVDRPVTRRRSSGFIAGIASDAVEITGHLRRQLDRSSTAA